MSLATHEGGDTFSYILNDGKEIELSDDQLQEICETRIKMQKKGFRSNSQLDILYGDIISGQEDGI